MVMANDFLTTEFRLKGQNFQNWEKNCTKKMGATDQPRYVSA